MGLGQGLNKCWSDNKAGVWDTGIQSRLLKACPQAARTLLSSANVFPGALQGRGKPFHEVRKQHRGWTCCAGLSLLL